MLQRHKTQQSDVTPNSYYIYIFNIFPVLPSFEVKITSRRPFFYVDDADFTVNINAV